MDSSFDRKAARARRIVKGLWLAVLAGGLLTMALDPPKVQAPAPDPGPRYENKSCTQCGNTTTRQVLVDPDKGVWRCMQCGADLWPANRVKK